MNVNKPPPTNAVSACGHTWVTSDLSATLERKSQEAQLEELRQHLHAQDEELARCGLRSETSAEDTLTKMKDVKIG